MGGFVDLNEINYEITMYPNHVEFKLYYTTKDRDDLGVLRFMHYLKEFKPEVLTVENEYVEIAVKLDLGYEDKIQRIVISKEEGKETITVDIPYSLENLDAVISVYDKLKDTEGVQYYLIDQGLKIRVAGIPFTAIKD